MVAVDITRTSQTDRIKFYVNGELQSQSQNNPSRLIVIWPLSQDIDF